MRLLTTHIYSMSEYREFVIEWAWELYMSWVTRFRREFVQLSCTLSNADPGGWVSMSMRVDKSCSTNDRNYHQLIKMLNMFKVGESRVGERVWRLKESWWEFELFTLILVWPKWSSIYEICNLMTIDVKLQLHKSPESKKTTACFISMDPPCTLDYHSTAFGIQ